MALIEGSAGGGSIGATPDANQLPTNTNSSYLSPMSMEDITKAANAQVGASIDSQVSPLEGQVGSLQGQMGGALAEIGGMFGSLLPYAQAESRAVSASWDQAQGMEKQIFDAANIQLNNLRQQRASEAQDLAQKMGGPVALGEFTAAVDPDRELLAHQGATQMLHTLMFAQAGEQASRAFSGQVLPLVRVESEARARSFYQGQIKDLETQISTLKAQKGPETQKAINDMMIQERTYALQRAQEKLAETTAKQNHTMSMKQLADDERKAERDWKAAQHQLRNDDQRVALAKGETTGVINGKPTLEKQRLDEQIRSATVQEKQQAQQLNISLKDYFLRKQQLAASTKNNEQRLAAANKATAAQYLDAAVNPDPGKTITITRSVPVAALAAQSGRIKDAYADKNSPTGYSRLVKITQQVSTAPITDPTSLVDYLVSHNVPKTLAVRMVKARLRLPNWTYGQPDPRGKSSGTGKAKG